MLSQNYISKEQVIKKINFSDPKQLRFAEQFLAHVSEDSLSGFAIEDLKNILTSSWEHVSGEKSDSPLIKITSDSFAQIYILNQDSPFIVNSITSLIGDLGYQIDLIVHPILTVDRDENGYLMDIYSYDKVKKHESFVYISLKSSLSLNEIEALNSGLLEVFDDLVKVVSHWEKMKTLSQEFSNDLSIEPFLNWLGDRYFVFLGACEYIDGKVVSTLGGVHQEYQNMLPSLMKFVSSPVHIFKIPYKSTVYARMPLDVIILSAANKKIIFFGLFTTHAYAQAVLSIPLIREKCQYVLDKSGFEPHWHDSKELIRIFESLPRDYLFQIEARELFDVGMGLLQLQKKQNVAVFLKQDPLGSLLTVLIYVSKEAYSTKVQKGIERFLEREIQGDYISSHVQLNDLFYARLQILIQIVPGKLYCFDKKGIEEKVLKLTQTWEERFFELLGRKEDIIFNSNYQDKFSPEQGIEDFALLSSSGQAKGDFSAIEGKTTLKISYPNSRLNLSDILPILDKMGIYVWSEDVSKIVFKNKIYYLHIFDLKLLKQSKIDPASSKYVIGLIDDILKGKIKNDRLNELVLTCGILPCETIILRAYSRYLQQIHPLFSSLFVEDILVKYPDFIRVFIDLFHEKFSPSLSGNTDQKLSVLRQFLKNITSVEEDKVLNLFINLIDSTLRTNFYQDNCSKEYISLKFDSLKVLGLPAPRPWREIFVYSMHMEGIHLRGGKIARGGIRWSDRRVDYRMEVLSLVKAQQVKNTVIVPTGSKGGFYVKTQNGAPPTLEEGIEAYKTLMRGMLDITDNIVKGNIAPPPDVVRYDEDDPYLVVAADKGTASFSDIANALSIHYEFWLQDAFASGGSQGYDHKKLAITSKGAWESVKHHFENLNIDIENSPFTVAGIGDMSGDVFGNGMLLSQNIKLIAAFDHRHIFIDPCPDPKISYQERLRLFNLPRSSWQDYDHNIISSGGGVFSRKDKQIELSGEIKTLLDLEGDFFTSNQIMSAILKSQVDLMWFGGIGTYVKASDETHTEAKDPANNDIRVNGSDLRAKVIGEGANLAMTQKGRIEYALNGGSLNTDAIDNSAGVNCSDHEINIKILLSAVLESGTLSIEDRNSLLARMANDVSLHVLKSNFDQPRSITKTYMKKTMHLLVCDFMIKFFKERKILDQKLEALPSYQEIQERYVKGLGLTRPELSVLLAFVKLFLRPLFLESQVLKQKEFEPVLLSYFPNEIVTQYSKYIFSHPLKQEIIVTLVLNEMVNFLGLDNAFNLYIHFASKIDHFIKIYGVLRLCEAADNVDNFLKLEFISEKTLLALKPSCVDQDIYILACAYEFNVNYDDLLKNYLNLRHQLGRISFQNSKSFADLYTIQKLNQELDGILINISLKNISGCDISLGSDHPIVKEIILNGCTSISEMTILINHLKSFI